MGKKILHTGELGSASILKVITNYLASVNLVSVGEALTVAKKSGMDLKVPLMKLLKYLQAILLYMKLKAR